MDAWRFRIDEARDVFDFECVPASLVNGDRHDGVNRVSLVDLDRQH